MMANTQIIKNNSRDIDGHTIVLKIIYVIRQHDVIACFLSFVNSNNLINLTKLGGLY